MDKIYVGSVISYRISIFKHKNKVIPGFTTNYNVHSLVYYEIYETYIEAARREKGFKNGCRQWKLNLIKGLNPEWRDLYQEISL